MRKFFHKTLWRIATDIRWSVATYEVKKCDWSIIYIDKELVETDREEVIEKDWIDDISDYYLNELISRGIEWIIHKDILKDAIYEYLPTCQKVTNKQTNRKILWKTYRPNV